jgi:hypothetical protein
MPLAAVRTRNLLLLQAAILLVATGCAVTSTIPVSRLESSEPILATLLALGTSWKSQGLGAEGKDAELVFSRNEDGSLG